MLDSQNANTFNLMLIIYLCRENHGIIAMTTTTVVAIMVTMATTISGTTKATISAIITPTIGMVNRLNTSGYTSAIDINCLLCDCGYSSWSCGTPVCILCAWNIFSTVRVPMNRGDQGKKQGQLKIFFPTEKYQNS